MTNGDSEMPGDEIAANGFNHPPAGAEGRRSSFEDALTELGDVVTRLESGSLGLSASIAAYEQGVALVRRLQEELTAVEQRVSLLVRLDEEGRPVLTDLVPPGDDGEAAGSPQPAKRAARRPRTRRLPGMDDAAEEA
jgi:exodeoxyribonuclease VII small subunit